MSPPVKGYIERYKGKPKYVRITIPGLGRQRMRLPADCSEARAEECRAYWVERVAAGDVLPAATEPTPEQPPPPPGSLEAYIDAWAADRRRRGRKRVDADREVLRTRLLAVLPPGIALVDVTDAHLRQVVERLDDDVLEERLAWTTAHHYWGSVTKLFDDAAHAKIEVLRMRKDNPAADVRGPDRGVIRASTYLYPREAFALLACQEIPVDRRLVYAIAMFTGLRRGELRALRTSDVVLSGGYIVVARSIPTGETDVAPTKSKRPRRVPIDLALRPLLAKLVEGRSPSVALLPQMRTLDVSRSVREDLRTAGLLRPELHGGGGEDEGLQRPLSFHDLRHTYATWCALRGDQQIVIQQRLGHSNPKMTARYIEAAEEVGRGDIGTPFPALPPLDVATRCGRKNDDSAENTGENWRAREDSKFSEEVEIEEVQGETGGDPLDLNEPNPAISGGAATWAGQMDRAVEVLRKVREERGAGDPVGQLIRYHAAANDVIATWAGRAA